MASILFYVVVAVGSLVVGVIISFILYLLFDFIRIRIYRLRTPTEKSILADPGKVEISEREVMEDEEEKLRKFRNIRNG